MLGSLASADEKIFEEIFVLLCKNTLMPCSDKMTQLNNIDNEYKLL